MTMFDAVVNLLVAAGFSHYVAFLVIDLVDGSAANRPKITALLAVVFAFCGLFHGLHGWNLATEVYEGHLFDCFVVSVQLFFVSIWTWLRYEALLGGPGDRSVSPPGILRSAWLGTYYPGVIVGALVLALISAGDFHWDVIPNVLVFLAFAVVSFTLVRTQVQRQAILGFWSLSSLAMAALFMNTGLSRLVFAALTISGSFEPTHAMVTLNAIGVVPAMAFPVAARIARPNGRADE